MQNKKIAVLLLLGILIPSAWVEAADYLPKNSDGGVNVVVSGNEPYRNLYTGGENVIINSAVLGDLFAAGGSVNLTAPVEEDFFAASGNVTVSGEISGDARIVGGNIVINAPIKGDLLVAGGTVSFGQNGSVGGDLWIGGGVVNLTSPVAGNVRIGGGEIFINNSILGELNVLADEQLTFGPSAVVLNKINYSGAKDPVLESGSQVGNIERDLSTAYGERDKNNLMNIYAFLKIIILLITALLMWKFLRKDTSKLITKSSEKFWVNFGVGLLGLIVIPIISLLLLITIVGMAISFILMLIYVLFIIIASVGSLFLMGMYIEKLLKAKKAEDETETVVHTELNTGTLLWGVLAMLVLGFIPYLGSVVTFVFFLVVFGGIIQVVRSRFLRN